MWPCNFQFHKYVENISAQLVNQEYLTVELLLFLFSRWVNEPEISCMTTDCKIYQLTF
jgi:hypothetical protein